MSAFLRQLQVVLLSLLFVWSGLAYAHHEETQQEVGSQVSASLTKAVVNEQVPSQKACDECCHGGGHSETVCNDPAPAQPIARAPLESALTFTPPSCSLPPPTPPPQV